VTNLTGEQKITLAVRGVVPQRRQAMVTKKPRTSRPGLAVVGGKSRSEHEGIICKVLGGQLLRACHQREWVNLNRRGGNTGLRVGDCPPYDAGQDQSGGAGCEQSGRLAHLNPPVVPAYCPRVK
jgi:hypothetical protein